MQWLCESLRVKSFANFARESKGSTSAISRKNRQEALSSQRTFALPLSIHQNKPQQCNGFANLCVLKPLRILREKEKVQPRLKPINHPMNITLKNLRVEIN